MIKQKGFKAVVILLVGALVLFVSGRVNANNEEPEEPEYERRLLPLKPYVSVSSRRVGRLADYDREVDVKFEARYRGRESAPERPVRFGDERYDIERALSLEGNIIGFIPRGHIDSLDTAAGLSRDQLVTVFGRIIGRRRGDNYVLVERLLTEEDDGAMPPSGYQVEVTARGGTPLEINKEGRYEFEFPCRYERDEVEDVRIDVREVARDEFESMMEELAESDGAEEVDVEEERRPAEEYERQYTSYDAITVYRAIGEDRQLNARFEDNFRRRVDRFPREVTVPDEGRVRIGAAFETESGLFCLLREREEEHIDRLEYLMRDMSFRARGVTVGVSGGERMFLVDKFEISGLIEPPEQDHVWIVSVLPHGSDPLMFYQEGEYRLEIPCNFSDRKEIIEVKLSGVQVIDMEL